MMNERTQHDGDCTIYASLSNREPTDGICTCGYGWSLVRKGDDTRMYSAERLKFINDQQNKDLNAQGGEGDGSMTLLQFLDLHYPISPADKGDNLYKRSAAHLGWTQAALRYELEIDTLRTKIEKLKKELDGERLLPTRLLDVHAIADERDALRVEVEKWKASFKHYDSSVTVELRTLKEHNEGLREMMRKYPPEAGEYSNLHPCCSAEAPFHRNDCEWYNALKAATPAPSSQELKEHKEGEESQ